VDEAMLDMIPRNTTTAAALCHFDKYNQPIHCFKMLCALKYKHAGHGNVKRNISTKIQQKKQKKVRKRGKQWRGRKKVCL
jgi:hypothetical protein